MLNIFKYPRSIFLILVLIFIIYSFSIYLIPCDNWSPISAGKDIWQQNNCHTCHQIYGLGGYLGPDLTNLVQKKGYSEEVIKDIIRNGRFQMPPFKLSEKELDDLIAFFKIMNEYGQSDPTGFKRSIWGTYEKKSH